MRRDFRRSAKQSQLWLETSHPPSADRRANPSDPSPYRQLAATGDQQKVRNGAKARPINKFNGLRPKPGSQGRLNCRGISSRGANGPDRHWVGWGAAIGTEALDGARARPPSTLSRRTQLYFGVSFGRSPRPRQPSGGRGLVHQAALRPSKPFDLKPQALSAPGRSLQPALTARARQY